MSNHRSQYCQHSELRDLCYIGKCPRHLINRFSSHNLLPILALSTPHLREREQNAPCSCHRLLRANALSQEDTKPCLLLSSVLVYRLYRRPIRSQQCIESIVHPREYANLYDRKV